MSQAQEAMDTISSPERAHIMPNAGATDEKIGLASSPPAVDPDGSLTRHRLMLRYLHKKCESSKWFRVANQDQDDPTAYANNPNDIGVLLRHGDGFITSLSNMNPLLLAAATNLNAKAAFTMSSDATASILKSLSPLKSELVFNSVVIPVAQSLADLARETSSPMRKFSSYACIVRDEKLVLIWHNFAEGLINHGTEIEAMFLNSLWGPGVPLNYVEKAGSLVSDMEIMNTPGHNMGQNTPHQSRYYSYQAREQEKGQINIKDMEVASIDEDPEEHDEEALKIPKRPTILTHAVIVTVSFAGVVVILINSVATLAAEIKLDQSYTRLALLVVILPQAFLLSFFASIVVQTLFQAFGPTSDICSNSKTFSNLKPKKFRHRDLALPHITIQMPVYMEGLKGVIQPTVSSLLAAVREYEKEGGTANIYINDDGLQLVPPEIAQQRIDFYTDLGIAYCSRPGHMKDGFERKGKFKKASNMNYALNTSLLIEEKFLELQDAEMRERNLSEHDILPEDDERWYEAAFACVIEESGGLTIAGGNVRIGEHILIVDSDTRVPKDCLIYAAMELFESPEVAILQHKSGILQVVHNEFEHGITYFNDLVQNSIEFNVGHGDVAPFMGHNAFVRWKALQSVSFEEDDRTKFWSEGHVSEDFDIALRLQIEGFKVRWASYHKGAFKEGVSLTVFDEITRWKKYSYGVSELMYNPLHTWIFKGPFTPLFYKFVFSKSMKVTSKFTILAYISTYYALAAGLPMAMLNYFVYGWFYGLLDNFYLESWKIFLPLILFFNFLGPLAYNIYRFRLSKNAFFSGLLETLRWTPMLILFFGGISWHLIGSICSHMFCINMEWGSTAKEIQASGFYVGVDRIFRDYKWMYLFCTIICAGMIYLSLFAPFGWTITQPTTLIPLAYQIGCHMLLPVVLGLDLI